MAERHNQSRQSVRDSSQSQPRVHTPGRLRESGNSPAPAESSQVASTASAVPAAQGGEAERKEPEQSVDPAPPDADAPAETDEATEEAGRIVDQSRLRRWRKLLHDCERLLLLDFDTLAMPHWPDHHALAVARRRRDTWILGLGILSVMVLAGMANLVPAVMAGVALGMLVVLAAWGFPTVRRVFTSEPSYLELLVRRRRMLHRARRHVEHLEGPLGLAACCRHLAEFNSALSRSRFQRLYRLSEQGRLAGIIRTRARAQLYLIFALEAEKAYNRLREAYLREYQRMLDEGEAEPLDALSQASDGSRATRGKTGVGAADDHGGSSASDSSRRDSGQVS